MNETPVIPLFDETTVYRTLERLRQAKPLGDTPLRHLVWIRQMIERSGPVVSPVGVEVVLGMALAGLIEENLVRLRAVEGLADGGQRDREAALAALREDFSRANAELEAWSVLYHRYVLLDLNLRVQDIAHTIGVSERQIHRRMRHGCRRLAGQISHREAEARARNRRAWLRLKLPPPAYTTLFDPGNALASLYDGVLSPPPFVTLLTGPGGIGKTALAHALAQRLIEEDRFLDFAWVSLTSQTAYATLLATLARSLDYFYLAESAPADLEAGLRVRLAGQRVLIVLDNADYLDDYADSLARLAALIAPGHAILTARRQPPSGAPVRIFPLSPLDRTSFEALLREHARLRRISQAERLGAGAVDAIYTATGGNPLAGQLVVSQLAFLPLERVLDNLARLDTGEGLSLFDRLFASTWEALDDTARHAALAMLVLPPEGAYWHDLLAASGLPAGELDHALQALITGSVVEAIGEEPRYVMHGLTRRFVEEQARQPRWAERYRRMLSLAVERQSREDEVSTSSVDDLSHTLALLHRQTETGERPEVLGRHIAQLAPMARRSGQWLIWRDVLRYVSEHLQESEADPGTLARTLLELGVAYRWLGEMESALGVFEQAIQHFGEVGDFIGQAEALLELGKLHEMRGQTEAAYIAYQRAAATAHRYRVPHLRRQALNGLAGLALRNQRVEEALDLLNQALATFSDDEPPDGQTLSLLGMAYLRSGDTEHAIAYQTQALARFEEEDDFPRLARTHLRLGMAYHAAGQQEKAFHHLTEGLALMQALGDALGRARILVNLGAIYAEEARWEEALETWHEAIALQQQLGDPVGMAYTWYNLADLRWQLGHLDAAREALEQARALAGQFNLVSLLARIEGHPLNG